METVYQSMIVHKSGNPRGWTSDWIIGRIVNQLFRFFVYCCNQNSKSKTFTLQLNLIYPLNDGAGDDHQQLMLANNIHISRYQWVVNTIRPGI